MSTPLSPLCIKAAPTWGWGLGAGGGGASLYTEGLRTCWKCHRAHAPLHYRLHMYYTGDECLAARKVISLRGLTGKQAELLQVVGGAAILQPGGSFMSPVGAQMASWATFAACHWGGGAGGQSSSETARTRRSQCGSLDLHRCLFVFLSSSLPLKLYVDCQSQNCFHELASAGPVVNGAIHGFPVVMPKASGLVFAPRWEFSIDPRPGLTHVNLSGGADISRKGNLHICFRVYPKSKQYDFIWNKNGNYQSQPSNAKYSMVNK